MSKATEELQARLLKTATNNVVATTAAVALLTAQFEQATKAVKALTSALDSVVCREPPEGWEVDPSFEVGLAEHGPFEMIRRELGMDGKPRSEDYDLDVLRTAARYIAKASACALYADFALDMPDTQDWACIGCVHEGKVLCGGCTAHLTDDEIHLADDVCVGTNFVTCAECGCGMLVQ